MAKNYITVDGGTTNTRIRLVSDRTIVDSVHNHVGARDGADALKTALKNGIRSLLERNGLSPENICRILASGMITGEFGLVNLPHLTAPAGIKELHEGMYESVFPEISPIPFCFIRGVRTQGNTLAETDMMRGEETELMGLLQEGTGLYVLPGSHSKLIQTDDAGRITAFSTMLTGEMIAALSSGTILKDAVTLDEHDIKEEPLMQGYQYARQYGINEALFKVRVLKNLFQSSPAERYSFFIGVVLADEISSILRHSVCSIIVAGRSALKKATVLLLQQLTDIPVCTVPDSEADTASTIGAIKIYEY